MEPSSELPDKRIVEAVRQSVSYRPEDFSANTEQSLARARSRIESIEREQTANRFRTRIWAPLIAAAAVVAVVAGTLLRQESKDVTATFTAARGERRTFMLADGSEMMLAPESRAHFVGSKRDRRIQLDGQAFFRVKHDASRPFVVTAQNATATDIGTEFVVRSYRADSSVNVAVTEGIVQVGAIGRHSDAILHKGEVALVDRSGATTVSHSVDARTFAGWMTGRLVFRDVTLSSIAAELSRWFNADITVADEQLGQQRLSAVYDKPSLDGALAALAVTTGAHVERSGNSIRLVRESTR